MSVWNVCVIHLSIIVDSNCSELLILHQNTVHSSFYLCSVVLMYWNLFLLKVKLNYIGICCYDFLLHIINLKLITDAQAVMIILLFTGYSYHLKLNILFRCVSKIVCLWVFEFQLHSYQVFRISEWIRFAVAKNILLYHSQILSYVYKLIIQKCKMEVIGIRWILKARKCIKLVD